MKPLVSICIPTYQGATYLKDALNSVVTQTYKNIEVVISDDDSKDETLEIISSFEKHVDFPVKICHHKPQGIGSNWNHCIVNAKGTYIKFLFQDDLLEPTCIEEQVDILESNDLKATCCQRTIIDSNSELVDEGGWYQVNGDLHKNIGIPDGEVYLFQKEDLKFLRSIIHNIFGEPDTFLYRKSIFDELGYFNTSYKQILDLDFSYRILVHDPIAIQAKKLIRFRLHSNQATQKNKGQSLSERSKLIQFIGENFYSYLPKKLKKAVILEKYPLLKKWGEIKRFLGLGKKKGIRKVQ